MRLIGKTAWFYLDGFRSGRIERVERGPRIGLRAVTVRLASGVRRKLRREREGVRGFRHPTMSGVLYRGRLVPLEQAAGEGGAR